MIQVKARHKEPVEKLLRRLKKQMEAEGTLKEYRDNRFFKKPSVKRREKSIKAAARRAREALK